MQYAKRKLLRTFYFELFQHGSVFTHSFSSDAKLENTPAGRDVIALEDKYLLQCTMQYAKRKLLRTFYFELFQHGLVFTHSSLSDAKLENTPDGRDVIALEDKYLL